MNAPGSAHDTIARDFQAQPLPSWRRAVLKVGSSLLAGFADGVDAGLDARHAQALARFITASRIVKSAVGPLGRTHAIRVAHEPHEVHENKRSGQIQVTGFKSLKDEPSLSPHLFDRFGFV